jgi:hypothetical protein
MSGHPTWHHLPVAARAIAVAASNAVATAQDRDRDGFEGAVQSLAAADGSGLILGAVVRLLLEELHPDGLDSEDIRRTLHDCVQTATQWQPTVDPHTVLILLASALGIHDEGEQAPQPDPTSLARHAALLLAELLTATPHPLSWYPAAALTEIQRTQLYD